MENINKSKRYISQSMESRRTQRREIVTNFSRAKVSRRNHLQSAAFYLKSLYLDVESDGKITSLKKPEIKIQLAQQSAHCNYKLYASRKSNDVFLAAQALSFHFTLGEAWWTPRRCINDATSVVSLPTKKSRDVRFPYVSSGLSRRCGREMRSREMIARRPDARNPAPKCE